MRRLCCLVVALPLVACGSEESRGSGGYVCDTCSRQAMGNPADDGQNTGLYKGVLLGSGQTATFEMTISTDRSTGSAKVFLPTGEVDSTDFTATALGADPTMGAYQYQFNAPTLSITATIEQDGSVLTQPTVTLGDVGGMPPTAVMNKENSTTLVECFEGTWQMQGAPVDDTMATSGAWNFVKVAEFLQGGYEPPMAVEGETGTLTGMTGMGAEPGQMQTGMGGMSTCTVNGDEASGTWTQESGGTANWTARRKR